jgi:hypothetical protein
VGALIYVTMAGFYHLDPAVITDPLFWLLAIPTMASLRLGKGGFAGSGIDVSDLAGVALAALVQQIRQAILLVVRGRLLFAGSHIC